MHSDHHFSGQDGRECARNLQPRPCSDSGGQPGQSASQADSSQPQPNQILVFIGFYRYTTWHNMVLLALENVQSWSHFQTTVPDQLKFEQETWTAIEYVACAWTLFLPTNYGDAALHKDKQKSTVVQCWQDTMTTVPTPQLQPQSQQHPWAQKNVIFFIYILFWSVLKF